MPQSAEELLIQRAKAGGVDAWEQLIVRYQGTLQDYIRYRYDHSLSGPISPDDILQETLLQAWLDIKSLNQTAPASFIAWLKSVADRRVSDALKSQQRQKRGGQLRRAANRIADGSASWFDLLEALPAEAQTASSIMSRKEAARALQVAVSLLPAGQRTAIGMHGLEGKSLRETADAMKRTVPAVRGLLHRGKQQLARDLASASSWLSTHTGGSRLLRQDEAGSEASAVDELESLGNAQPRDLIGQTVSHYRIVERIGAGGMGVVYRAEDTRLSRNVALKFLPEQFTPNSRAVERFTREARAASALNHPNIVTIHEIAAVDGLQFIVMELVEGRTLRTMLAQNIPMESLKELGTQAARALAVAHAAGIIHRDIKPENVVVRDDGYVKVLDFGLARLMTAPTGPLDDAARGSDTGPGVVLGTVRYMSPEQTQGETLSGASDVFSLGIVLYELATGRNPFEAESHQAVIRHILSERPLPPSRLNPEVSSDFERLIIEMLQKDPRLRPTAGDVETRLTGLSGQEPAKKSGGQENLVVSAAQRHTVGREEPLATLRAELESALTGQGRLVCVAGEPGIGKTTLLNDFLMQLQAERNTFSSAQGTCSERLAGAEAYLPILEVLESLTRGNNGEIIARTLRLLAPTWYVRIVSLSMEDSSTERVLADAKMASQERMKRELISFLEELCRNWPLILFLEDVHWADVSTVDLLAYIGTKLGSMRLLIVATYRPTELQLSDHVFARFKLELQGRGRCRELALGLLTRTDIDKYLVMKFPEHRFPVEFADLVHTRTGGNPLFMVDLLRFFQDRRVIAQEGGRWELVEPVAEIEDEIPESVRSMVQKKIDQLTDDDRRLLTAASVQGFEFDATVVAHTLEMDAAEVEERLDVLDQVHAFVRFMQEREFPDRTLTARYCFVHVLYQNGLYAALRPTRRASISASVAQALLGHYGERSANVASELAILLETARDFARSAKYFGLAAEHAAGLCAYFEAVSLTRRGLEVLEFLPETLERTELELHLRMALGPALMATTSWSTPEVKANYSRARKLCEQIGNTPQLFPTTHGFFMFAIAHAEIQAARELADDLLRLAKTYQNPAFFLMAHHSLANVGWPAGEFELGLMNANSGTALYEAKEHHSLVTHYIGSDPGVMCLFHASPSLWCLGYPDQAVRSSQEALRLALELSHPSSVAAAHNMAAIVFQLRGEPKLVRQHADAAITLGPEIGAPYLPRVTVLHGWALACEGQTEEGLEQLLQGIAGWRARGVEALRPYFLTLLAHVHLQRGEFEEGLEAVEEAQELIEKTGERFSEAEVYRMQGALMLMREPVDEATAEARFRQALEVARRQQAKSHELRAVMSLCGLLRERGQADEARSILADIYDWFREGFDTRDLQEAKSLLELIAGQNGMNQ